MRSSRIFLELAIAVTATMKGTSRSQKGLSVAAVRITAGMRAPIGARNKINPIASPIVQWSGLMLVHAAADSW